VSYAIDALTVVVDMGSATSWDRRPEWAWVVRLGRGDRSVIVAWGLSRPAAEALAERIVDVVWGAAQPRCWPPRPGGHR
jgi:hypothetical protein